MGEMSVLDKVVIRLGKCVTESEKEFLLPILIETAINDVKNERNYPDTYTEDMMEADLKKYENIIISLVMYDYNTQGAEFQSYMSENSINRGYRTRDSILKDVIPFVGILS